MTFNTTQNKFYEKVILKKGGKPKSIVSPNENLKADLGTPQKKIKNIYVNNFRGSTPEVVRGTWRPAFVFYKDKDQTILTTGRETPSFQIIEAKYQKIKGQVSLFANFSLTGGVSTSQPDFSAYTSISGLPFLNDSTQLFFSKSNVGHRSGSLWTGPIYSPPSSNLYVYNFTPLGSVNIYRKTSQRINFFTKDDKQKITSLYPYPSVQAPSPKPYFAIAITKNNLPQTKYFYFSGTYATIP